MTEPSQRDPFKAIVYGIAATASLGYFGWLGASVVGIGDRLTVMETTIVENKEERREQINELRQRVGRLEEEAYRKRANGRTE
jgi:hypothetical protein